MTNSIESSEFELMVDRYIVYLSINDKNDRRFNEDTNAERHHADCALRHSA